MLEARLGELLRDEDQKELRRWAVGLKARVEISSSALKDGDPTATTSLLQALGEVSGLYHERLKDTIMFIHHSFQEFLAARFLLFAEKGDSKKVFQGLVDRFDEEQVT